MYTRVLIAFDGSEAAPHVLDQALLIARSEAAAIEIVTVIPGYQGDLRLHGSKSALDELHSHYRSSLDTAIQMALARGIRVRSHLTIGDPAEEILRLSEELHVDLIATGKRTQPVVAPLTIGSVASDVINHSNVDVLVAAGNRTVGLDRLFLAFDGSSGSISAAQQACALASRYGAHLTIGTAYEMDMEAYSLAPDLEQKLHAKAEACLQQAVQLAERSDVTRVDTVISHGTSLYKTLIEEAVAADAGLMITGASKRSKLSQALLGGVISRMLADSAFPVLIVKE